MNQRRNTEKRQKIARDRNGIGKRLAANEPESGKKKPFAADYADEKPLLI